ncbi:MAG: ATP-binding protein [Okeania sp. SIO3I5]|uniref:hypothetical protein n=1 Tax=Okeania sp. SIO3I5 TaxID=2607805 RepID=UPI0013BC7C55|nr:hypothetical protein [Okeania sp. SIO3I5]NEQ41898.1 ATP-binding protein [Okeania sp. SIO3I5]
MESSTFPNCYSIKNNWSGTTSIFVLKSYQDDSLKKFLELVSNIFCPGNTIPSNIITDHYYRSRNNKSDVYENFTNWYYYLLYLHDNYKIYGSYKDNIPALEKQLQQAINGFKHILFSSNIDKDFLMAEISGKFYSLSNLSQGQPALIILYTLIFCTPRKSILCINKPETFLALPEVMSWLSLMVNHLKDRQLLLISHHPSMINYLGANSGYFFERTDDNSVQVKRINQEDEDEESLSIEKLIELGSFQVSS